MFEKPNQFKIKFTFIWTIVLALVYKSTAQVTYEQFDYLTITEGLPHNTVYCLTQDKTGFIWIGTKDGLVRYDGYNCKVYRKGNSISSNFSGKNIHAILEDKQGNLWIGTQTEGIILRNYQSGIFKNLSDDQLFKPLEKKWIKVLFEDQKGRIWIGTIGNGLWCYQPKTHQLTHFDNSTTQYFQNAVSSIIEDKKGQIWVGTNGKGIFLFDEKKQNFQRINTENSNFLSFRKTLFVDKTGNLWVGTEGSGLYKISATDNTIQNFTTTNGLASNYVMGIAQNTKGQLILATDGGGLSIFDVSSNQFHWVKSNKNPGSLNTNALYNVFIDRDANIWIGTYDGGVNIFKAHKTRFEHFTHTGNQPNELSHRSVLSINQTANGQIYVGTDGGGLHRFDSDSKKFIPIQNGTRNIVKTIVEDSKKRLWLGYFERGMSYFDPSTNTFKHFEHDPTDSSTIGANNVWSITEDQEGNIWAGILGGGIAKCEAIEKGQFRRYLFDSKNVNSLSSNDVIIIYSDNQDRLWIGTDTKGLNLFDKKNGKFIRYQNNKNDTQSLSANDIRCIYQDSKNRLWIGTESGGLNLWLGNGKFKHFNENSGLLSNAIMGIIEDKKGFLWLSTFKGLCRFDVEKNQFLNFSFSEKSYFMANLFNQGAALGKTSNGYLYWGGTNGLTRINPENVKTFQTPPTIVLTDFKVFNQSTIDGSLPDGHKLFEQSLENTKTIRLSYKENVFSFEFAALDFTDPQKNVFTYKLDGFDKNWQRTTNGQLSVTYTNLNPGTYYMRIKGSNSYGIWSKEKQIQVVISPPFWKTWWFRLLTILFLVSLILFLLKIYTTRREMLLKQQVLENDRSILALKNDKLISETTILNLQKENLSQEVELKNQELLSKAMQMAHKKEFLEEINLQLEKIKNVETNEKNQLLKQLKSMIGVEIRGEDNWAQFHLYFDQVNSNFTEELLKSHPNLTQNDVRMCALCRLNMSNKEMAILLNVTTSGIEKSKYRLKKRLNLQAEDDLIEYLRGF